MSNKKLMVKKKERPDLFQSFNECIKWNKKSVYLIARGRKMVIDGKESINWITLGSGFLAAQNRFVSAAHVVNNLEGKNDLARHKAGDSYYLLRHDDENQFHAHISQFVLDKDLFLYPDIDIAIFYLKNSFYEMNGRVVIEKNNYIPISKEFFSIGTEIGILGYPICKLTFSDGNLMKPNIGNVLLRTDLGVINCRYQTSEVTFAYEFTLAFNPGNSGGPIFHAKGGRVISIVKGFNSLIMSKRVDENIKNPGDKKISNHAHATYSSGFATPTFLKIFKTHNIIK